MTAMPTTDSPAQLLYPDLASELASTRRVLERVPEARADWQPHDKSFTLGRLASHVAELPNFGTLIMRTDELDFAKGAYTPLAFESTAQIVAEFDRRAGEMQQALHGATWEALGRRWVMRGGDVVYVEGVKSTLIRSFGLSHLTHHRAQLGVYLRLLGVAVPQVYGPTADEP